MLQKRRRKSSRSKSKIIVGSSIFSEIDEKEACDRMVTALTRDLILSILNLGIKGGHLKHILKNLLVIRRLISACFDFYFISF